MVHLVKVRADARRNRDAILSAARELIARDGVDVTMESLAERAEVAVGTLYRHYPTKTDLVAAVLGESVAAIAAMTDEALHAAESDGAAGDALAGLIRRVAAAYATDAGIKQAAAGLGVPTDIPTLVSRVDGAASRAVSALARLLAAAQSGGEVRPDLTVDDLLMLVGSAPGGADGRSREQYLAVMLAGIRATPQG